MKKGEKKNITDLEVKPIRKRIAKKTEVTSVVPSDEQIRSRARDIYNERVQKGEHGTPESDWYAALESLK